MHMWLDNLRANGDARRSFDAWYQHETALLARTVLQSRTTGDALIAEIERLRGQHTILDRLRSLVLGPQQEAAAYAEAHDGPAPVPRAA